MPVFLKRYSWAYQILRGLAVRVKGYKTLLRTGRILHLFFLSGYGAVENLAGHLWIVVCCKSELVKRAVAGFGSWERSSLSCPAGEPCRAAEPGGACTPCLLKPRQARESPSSACLSSQGSSCPFLGKTKWRKGLLHYFTFNFLSPKQAGQN